MYLRSVLEQHKLLILSQNTLLLSDLREYNYEESSRGHVLALASPYDHQQIGKYN